MTELKGVMSAAAEVEAFCRDKRWQFCFIGGVAVQRWGVPRFTQDVDVTLLTGLGGEEAFIDLFLGAFAPRVSDARTFALQNRVLLARSSSGVDLDVALGAFPFEEATIQRATTWKAKRGIALTTCSAEDLIVQKVFAGRDRDWGDVEAILVRQHRRLDLDLARRELLPLLALKEDSGSLAKLERMIDVIRDRLDPRRGNK